jgi:hypothetical protein
MMSERDVSRLIDDHDVDGLVQTAPAAVQRYLRNLLSELDDSAYPPDADRLLSLGNTLYLSGWARADRMLASLLSERLTEQRLDAVSLVLAGLWKAGRHPTPVSRDALETLVQARLSLGDVGVDADHSYRVALDNARRAATTAGDAATARLASTHLQGG